MQLQNLVLKNSVVIVCSTVEQRSALESYLLYYVILKQNAMYCTC